METANEYILRRIEEEPELSEVAIETLQDQNRYRPNGLIKGIDVFKSGKYHILDTQERGQFVDFESFVEYLKANHNPNVDEKNDGFPF